MDMRFWLEKAEMAVGSLSRSHRARSRGPVERDRLDLPPGLGRAGDGECGATPRGIRTRVHTLTTKTMVAAKHDQESLALAEELAMRSLVGPVPPRAGECLPVAQATAGRPGSI